MPSDSDIQYARAAGAKPATAPAPMTGTEAKYDNDDDRMVEDMLSENRYV